MNIPSLYDDYKKFERIIKRYEWGSSSLDVSNERFLAPTTLIPLLCFSKNNNISNIATHYNTHDYIKRIIEGKTTSTTTPYQILPKSPKERQDSELSLKMANLIKPDYGGFYVLYHILSELTNNIYNHTPFEEDLASYGYTYAQEFPNLLKEDICVMDDGLSIPGRFSKSGIEYVDDCHAIQLAINNNSTASSNKEERGNGLWTTIRLVVEGNGGEVLIVSRNGCLHIKSLDHYKYYHLNNGDYFKGTLISVRLNKKEVQNIRNLIEVFPGLRYEYK